MRCKWKKEEKKVFFHMWITMKNQQNDWLSQKKAGYLCSHFDGV